MVSSTRSIKSTQALGTAYCAADRSRPSHRNNLRVFVWIEPTLEDLAMSVAHRIAVAVRHGDEVGLRLHVSEPLPIDRAGVAGAVTNFPPANLLSCRERAA